MAERMNDIAVAEMIAQKRAQKAVRIAEVLREHGVTAAEMELASEENWKLAAQAAGTRYPSAETQAIVIGMLRDMEASNEK